MRLLFWKKEETPQDVAKKMLSVLKARQDSDEVAYYLFRLIYPGKHVHGNPKRRV